MYTVKVYRTEQATGQEKPYDTETFPYGSWANIGYWLDNLGYIDPEYRVEVTFS